MLSDQENGRTKMLKDIQTIVLLFSTVFSIGFGVGGYAHHDPQIKDNSVDIVAIKLDIVRANQKELDLEDKFNEILDNLHDLKDRQDEKEKKQKR